MTESSSPRLANPVPPGAPDHDPGNESLAKRYARIAHAYEGRPIDAVLRTMDIAIAGVGLLLLSPLVAIVAVATLITSGQPVLYRGDRVGRAGRVFSMYKFRTLASDAETRLGPYLGPELTKRTEAEVTGVGKALRPTHLDEVPQLWNVLRGDMSIVGPRPVRPTFFEELCELIPGYWQRLVVRPGVTGFAQTRITREESWADKLAHDMEYIADRSVRLYLRVLAGTGWRVLRRIAGGQRQAPA
ncbi:MAG: sugar transferase [Actinomycetota bacterium]|nr:sugar transferase [Actinomycetota bacterium]